MHKYCCNDLFLFNQKCFCSHTDVTSWTINVLFELKEEEQANTYYICLAVCVQNLKWLSHVIMLFSKAQDMSLEPYEPTAVGKAEI